MSAEGYLQSAVEVASLASRGNPVDYKQIRGRCKTGGLVRDSPRMTCHNTHESQAVAVLKLEE